MNQMLLLEKQALKDEVRKLNERENDIIQKALEVEKEMNLVKSKKMEIVVGMYQDQLILEYKRKQEDFEKQQNEKLLGAIQNLQIEKDKKMQMTDTLYVSDLPRIFPSHKNFRKTLKSKYKRFKWY